MSYYSDPDLRVHAQNLLNRLAATLEMLRVQYPDDPSREAIDDAYAHIDSLARCLKDVV